jgi:hypothetical protein
MATVIDEIDDLHDHASSTGWSVRPKRKNICLIQALTKVHPTWVRLYGR